MWRVNARESKHVARCQCQLLAVFARDDDVLTHLFERGDEGAEGDDAGIREQASHLSKSEQYENKQYKLTH